MKITPRDEKPGLIGRLNPASWFRSKEKEKEPSPVERVKPEPRQPAPANPPSSSNPATKLAAAAPPAVESASFPRYPYRSPGKPSAGDRRRAEPSFAQGYKAHQERRLTAALAAYRQALTLDPAFFEAYYNLGLAAYEMRDLPQSVSAYEAALSINPASFDARYNFALALQQGNYALDAADELNRALEQHPEQARAHFSLAKLYAEQLSRPDLARRHYQKVLDLEPRHPQATAIRYWLVANP